jgi:proteasome lid subunit RPN8/RPN11
MLTVATPVWEATLDHVRRCGDGRRECVVYWVGPADQTGVVDRVVHPVHRATAGYYELDDAWVTKFWLELARSGATVRVQVHTHAFSAFHSATDDKWPLVHVPGFLSLVIPNFGLGPLHADELFLVEIDDAGRWRRVDPQERLGRIP